MENSNQFLKTKLPLIIAAAILVGAGMGIELLIGAKQPAERAANESARPLRIGLQPGKFANPLLACDGSEAESSPRLNALKKSIEQSVNNMLLAGEADRVSVYYRDLDAGLWTGVNENELFIPASLVKVPLLIAYLKAAESQPEILKKKVVYDLPYDEDASREISKPPDQLTPGNSYSVSELLYRMVAYSGNNSHILLARALAPEYQKKINLDLNIHYSGDLSSPTADSISAKSYATYFRVLYNGSYLNDEMSEKALNILSQTTFTQGLIAGVPTDVKVAHKFGERTIHYNSTGEVILRELHDCGIIYYPNRPYALCVMTRGMNFEKLKNVISDISKTVYDEETKQ